MKKEKEMNQVIRYFEYEHLPLQLQKIAKPICELAQKMEETLPDNAEKSAGLRKLLEAKDAFVRANIVFKIPTFSGGDAKEGESYVIGQESAL